jgi:hypothetical protein
MDTVSRSKAGHILTMLHGSNREELISLKPGEAITYSIHADSSGNGIIALGRLALHTDLGPPLHIGSVRRDSASDPVSANRWVGLRQIGEVTVFSSMIWRATAARLISDCTESHVNRDF